MRLMLFTIGFVLILGGVYAVVSPRAAVLISSGPDAASEYPRPVFDQMSKERSKKLGCVALLIGVGFCTAAVWSRDLKVPEPHDNAA